MNCSQIVQPQRKPRQQLLSLWSDHSLDHVDVDRTGDRLVARLLLPSRSDWVVLWDQSALGEPIEGQCTFDELILTILSLLGY